MQAHRDVPPVCTKGREQNNHQQTRQQACGSDWDRTGQVISLCQNEPAGQLQGGRKEWKNVVQLHWLQILYINNCIFATDCSRDWGITSKLYLQSLHNAGKIGSRCHQISLHFEKCGFMKVSEGFFFFLLSWVYSGNRNTEDFLCGTHFKQRCDEWLPVTVINFPVWMDNAHSRSRFYSHRKSHEVISPHVASWNQEANPNIYKLREQSLLWIRSNAQCKGSVFTELVLWGLTGRWGCMPKAVLWCRGHFQHTFLKHFGSGWYKRVLEFFSTH